MEELKAEIQQLAEEEGVEGQVNGSGAGRIAHEEEEEEMYGAVEWKAEPGNDQPDSGVGEEASEQHGSPHVARKVVWDGHTSRMENEEEIDSKVLKRQEVRSEKEQLIAQVLDKQQALYGEYI